MSVVGGVKGKAIVRIERMDSEWVPFHTETEILEDNCSDERYYEEDFSMMDTDTVPTPVNCENLEVGQSITVKADFEWVYTKDYWGEYDSELYWENAEVVEDEVAQ